MSSTPVIIILANKTVPPSRETRYLASIGELTHFVAGKSSKHKKVEFISPFSL